ncbi:FAD-binding domain-containing protein [Scheffersomyces xylosifermentans]|uniref:FAD-binding domain-containing protein n=1 Tax=Scheffersomyces xylosifermentans TaxID=1304137 RepID=UPI00315D9A22
MHFLWYWGIFLSFVTYASAHGASAYTRYGTPLKALYGCSYQISKTATFCTAGKSYDIPCFCSNPNAFATFTGCLSITGRNTTSVIHKLFEYCEEEGNVTLTQEMYDGAFANYTKFATLPSDIEGFNASLPVDVPIKLNETLSALIVKSYDMFLDNYDYSLYYSAGILGYWLLVLLLGAITNWSKILFPGLVKSFTGKGSNLFRKYVTVPATISKKKSNEQKLWRYFDFLIPSRLESVITFGFIVVTIGLSSCNLHYIEGDPLFDSKFQVLNRYVADRTGIIATVIMPLLILFAGRNNFLQWITGWNFATFLVYHRWIARVDFIFALIHTLCWSRSLLAADMAETYLIWGSIAVIAGFIMFFHGILYLRRRWYEFFLLTHIIMAALYIAGTWIHVVELGYVWFMYPAVAVWVFDRVVRIGRLVVFGFPKADVILLADETLKVIIPKPKYWHSIPGGHAFIHFIRPSCFWQSHPFTFTDSVENKDSIVLYCKVKGGITHGLYQYLAAHPGKTTQIRVGVEGPYGEPTPARKYDLAVFIAGGNGIPGIYSEAVDAALRTKDKSNNMVKLYWVIREYRSLFWFYEELLELKKTKIQTTVYVTRPDSLAHLDEFHARLAFSPKESVSEKSIEVEVKDKEIIEKYTHIKDESSASFGSDKINEEEEAKSAIISIIKQELSHVKFVETRPAVEDIIKTEIEESPGSVAFVACGHPAMVDDVRYSVVQNIENPEHKRIEFFEQLQVWA